MQGACLVDLVAGGHGFSQLNLAALALAVSENGTCPICGRSRIVDNIWQMLYNSNRFQYIYIQYFDVQEWMVTDLPLDLGYAVYTPVLDTHITPAQQVSSADNLDTFYFSSKFMTVTKR